MSEKVSILALDSGTVLVCDPAAAAHAFLLGSLKPASGSDHGGCTCQH
ncbi:MAG: hypothetical protein PHU46_02235 [Rhodocyclaceae bacterium]|nr:hypothetical protein [Rhodocyclaceae bacterium]